MQLSQKEKAFSQIAAAFLKSRLSFEFKKKKKMTLIANFFRIYRLAKTQLNNFLKSPLSETVRKATW